MKHNKTISRLIFFISLTVISINARSQNFVVSTVTKLDIEGEYITYNKGEPFQTEVLDKIKISINVTSYPTSSNFEKHFKLLVKNQSIDCDGEYVLLEEKNFSFDNQNGNFSWVLDIENILVGCANCRLRETYLRVEIIPITKDVIHKIAGISNTCIATHNLEGFENTIEKQYEDEYLNGDWDGNGKGNIAVRRGNKIYMDYNYDGQHDKLQSYGWGNKEDEYLVGDWDGDGKDNIAVRRGNKIYMDYNYDGQHDKLQSYGWGNRENDYLVGDWDGDGKDNIAVRRRDKIYMDYNYDGQHDKLQSYGWGRYQE